MGEQLAENLSWNNFDTRREGGGRLCLGEGYDIGKDSAKKVSARGPRGIRRKLPESEWTHYIRGMERRGGTQRREGIWQPGRVPKSRKP